MDRLLRATRSREEGGAPDDAAFAADFTSAGVKLRLRGRRHRSALSAVWSVGPDERVVAASVLLAGSALADDAAAVVAVRDGLPRLPFEAADFDQLAAEPRPCLATLYVDARWYDNSRVELAATALALASVHGPERRLEVRDDAPRDNADPAQPEPVPSVVAAVRAAQPRVPWFNEPPRPLQFDFTRPRLQLVMRMVTKKANAAITAMPGVHFRVHPPREFLSDLGVLRGAGIFEKLKDSTWSVRWFDGEEDRLSFGEFLGFLHQVEEIEAAYSQVAGSDTTSRRAPQNESTWGRVKPAGPGGRMPIKVSRVFNTRELTQDDTVRRLLSRVALECEALPPGPIPTNAQNKLA
jgi:hypothetical protein